MIAKFPRGASEILIELNPRPDCIFIIDVIIITIMLIQSISKKQTHIRGMFGHAWKQNTPMPTQHATHTHTRTQMKSFVGRLARRPHNLSMPVRRICMSICTERLAGRPKSLSAKSFCAFSPLTIARVWGRGVRLLDVLIWQIGKC